jgi:hypothetical protein
VSYLICVVTNVPLFQQWQGDAVADVATAVDGVVIDLLDDVAEIANPVDSFTIHFVISLTCRYATGARGCSRFRLQLLI